MGGAERVIGSQKKRRKRGKKGGRDIERRGVGEREREGGSVRQKKSERGGRCIGQWMNMTAL